MKKLLVMLLVGAIALISFSGCIMVTANSGIYYDSIVQSNMDGIEFVLTDEEEAAVLEILNSSEWTDGALQVTRGYVFLTGNDEKIYYAPGNGCVYDSTNERYAYLSENDKIAVNVIVCSKVIPPVEMLGPRLEKENVTLSEMIDAYMEKLGQKGYESIFIADRLWGGDIESAKSVLDNDLLRELFPSPKMRFERYFDHWEWRDSVYDEDYKIIGVGIELCFSTYRSFEPSDRYIKVDTDAGEYFRLRNEYLIDGEHTRIYIDLGENVILHIKVDEDSSASADKLLEYGLAVRERVLNVDEPPTEPVTAPVTEPTTEPATEPVTEPVTEPTTEPIEPPVDKHTEAPAELPTEMASCGGDTESTGCGSTMSGGVLLIAPLAVIGAFCVTKRKKK